MLARDAFGALIPARPRSWSLPGENQWEVGLGHRGSAQDSPSAGTPLFLPALLGNERLSTGVTGHCWESSCGSSHLCSRGVQQQCQARCVSHRRHWESCSHLPRCFPPPVTIGTSLKVCVGWMNRGLLKASCFSVQMTDK